MTAESSVRLRAAHTSEAAAIAALSRLHIEHGLSWRWTPARVRRQLLDPDTMTLVASADGRLAGFAIMHFGEVRARLVLLAVDPRYRRNGIASSLLDWLEKSCVTAGIQEIRLEVRAGNKGAQQFYVSRGFRLAGRIAGYYDGRESALLMAKSLAAA